ncbi:MAG: Glutathione S-transferase, N-terminal domain [Solirubrobacteraceae bacterium]|nr:Glutathione S-transferase, N-terminal domain [Solirubrobacteraceae bacterium]
MIETPPETSQSTSQTSDIQPQASDAPSGMSETPSQTSGAPTLYVCHGDEKGPRMHPCRRVQEALHEAGIEYRKVRAAHGSPIPFLRKGSREELREATGDTKLPTMKLSDGTVLTHSRPILDWIKRQ